MGSREQVKKNIKAAGRIPAHLRAYYGMGDQSRMIDRWVEGVDEFNDESGGPSVHPAKSTERPRRGNAQYEFDPSLYRLTGLTTGLVLMHLADASAAFGRYKVNEAEPLLDRPLCAELNQALNSPETFEQIRQHFPLMDKKPVTLCPSACGIGLKAHCNLPGETNISLYVGVIIPTDEPEKHYSARELREQGLNPPIPSDRKCQGTITVRFVDKDDLVYPVIIVGWNTPDALDHFSLDPACIGGNWADHSCEPNCVLDSVEINVTVRGIEYSIDVPCIKTIEPVGKDQYLTVGYGSNICLNGTAYDPKYSKKVEKAGKATSRKDIASILKGVPLKLDMRVINAFVARSRLIECACIPCESNKTLGFYQTVLCMDKASGVDQAILLLIIGFGAVKSQLKTKPKRAMGLRDESDSGVESADSTESGISGSSDSTEISKRWRPLRPNGHEFYVVGVSRSYRQAMMNTEETMGARKWFNRQVWMRRIQEKRAMEARVAKGAGSYADVVSL